MHNVEITETAFSCLQDIESFKVNTLGADKAAIFVDQILGETVSAIGADPMRYRNSQELAEFGLLARERIDSNGYRTIYELIDSVAHILLILHTKQDVELALYRHMIVRR